MISDQSSAYFSFINKIKYKYFQIFHSGNFLKFLDLIKFGILPRPHYALCLLIAAHQAKSLGYKKISIIEFGCWECDGLIDIENYIDDIKKIFDIEFAVYGFDLGDGHPEYKRDPRDRLYELSKGDYTFKKKDNLQKLKYTKMIWGDVKDTVRDFIKDEPLEKQPIGFISFDLGLYTSTKNALSLLNEKSDFFIPRVPMYFDNKYFVLENEGDLYALKEFNNTSSKKISEIGEMAEQMSLSWKKWIFLGKRVLMLSDLNHEKYNIHYEQIVNMNINKKFTKTII